MKITAEELKQKIENGDTFIVDMYADWCGPCRMMHPVIESVSKKLIDDNHEVNVYKFNIEDDKELAIKLGVRNIPNTKAFSDGEIVINKVGILSEQQIIDMANEIIS